MQKLLAQEQKRDAVKQEELHTFPFSIPASEHKQCLMPDPTGLEMEAAARKCFFRNGGKIMCYKLGTARCRWPQSFNVMQT